jgi:hypothetical protein
MDKIKKEVKEPLKTTITKENRPNEYMDMKMLCKTCGALFSIKVPEEVEIYSDPVTRFTYFYLTERDRVKDIKTPVKCGVCSIGGRSVKDLMRVDPEYPKERE